MVSLSPAPQGFHRRCSGILLIGRVRKRTKTGPALCCLIQTGPLPAFELARSGRYLRLEEILRRLNFEGYRGEQVMGPAIRRQLRRAIKESRPSVLAALPISNEDSNASDDERPSRQDKSESPKLR